MEIPEEMKSRTDSMMRSTEELNKAAIDKLEQAAKLNLDSMAYYTEIGLRQLRAVSSVRDVESTRRFAADSIALSGDIGKRMLSDGQSWAGLANNMKKDVSDLFGNATTETRTAEVEPDQKKKTAAPAKGA